MMSLATFDMQLLAAGLGGTIGGLIGAAVMLVVFWLYNRK